VPFLKSPVLRPNQEDDYNLPGVSEQVGTIYEHCIRALEHGYKLGAHGLPLMGTGDWNDGMNRVGAQGKGESVWNGWFFITVLNAFAELDGAATRRGRRGAAAGRGSEAAELTPGRRAGIAEPTSTWHPWDRPERRCQIDAIPRPGR
jgi:cellobiose phosphorylase